MEKKIYIIDAESEGSRPENTKESIDSLFESGCVDLLNPDIDSLNHPKYPCIIFAHASDIDRLKNREEIWCHILDKNALLVLYSGSGEVGVMLEMRDEKIRSQNTQNICIVGREVSRSNGGLSDDEISTIENQIRISDEDIWFENPDCLGYYDVSYLTALSILCQGFILVYKGVESDELSNSSLELQDDILDVENAEEFWPEKIGSSFNKTISKIKSETSQSEIPDDSPIKSLTRKTCNSDPIEDLDLVRSACMRLTNIIND